jgi:hypothetical protein
MKARYDHIANSALFQEGDQVWLFHQTWTRGKALKLQSSWEGLSKAITQIRDVVICIRWHPRAKIVVVHLDRLAPYVGLLWMSSVEEGAE